MKIKLKKGNVKVMRSRWSLPSLLTKIITNFCLGTNPVWSGRGGGYDVHVAVVVSDVLTRTHY